MAQTKEEEAAKKKAYNEAWYEANKEERKSYNKAYREANKEEIAAQRKSHREANKEALSVRSKAYYEANKEALSVRSKAYREANKEKVLAGKKVYREANREKVVADATRRKALKRKLVPIHLRDCPHEKQRLLQTYKLRKILSEATGVQHHVDHMWPLADGGPHWSGNLQIIPAEENMSKHASVCEETKATIIKSLYTFDTSRPI